MFNFYNNSISPESIADFGAQRTLKMDGSLMGYIQTGNRYDSHYCHSPKADVFEKKRSKARLNKTLTELAIAAGSVLGVYLLIKNGKKIKFKNIDFSKFNLKKPDFKKLNLKELFSGKVTKKSGDFLDDCFDAAKKNLDKVRAKQV